METKFSSIRNVLKVFLASPGDLLSEREEVKHIIDRLNKGFGTNIGWMIELLGWEDSRPGCSRPQEIIDKDVEQCDLFLGILWKRWGQPTGNFDSGFYEEFCLAKSLHTRSKKPEIWLYFKAIDAETLKDPGEQLKKVLSFKLDLINKKDLFFKEFNDIKEWNEIIFDHLQKYLFELSEKIGKNELNASHILNIQSTKTKISNKSKTGLSNKTSSELISLFNKIKLNYEKNELQNINIWDRIRLYLNANALISEKIPGKIIGIHEINFLYLKKNIWNFSEGESIFLFKSIVCDKNVLRPGWFWFKDWSEKKVNDTLILFAEKDNDLLTKQMCLSLLAESNYLADKDFINKFISYNNVEIVINAIKLIKNTNNIDFTELLEKLINSTKNIKIKNAAVDALFEIHFNVDPNNAFLKLIKYGSEIPLKIKKDRDLLNNIKDDVLIKSLTEGASNINKYIANYLIDSNKLNDNIYNIFLECVDIDVRNNFLTYQIQNSKINDVNFIEKWISEQNKQFVTLSTESNVNKNELIQKVLLNKNKDELLKEFEAFSTYNQNYYRTLAENHFSFFENQIKADLDDNFENVSNKYTQKIFESKANPQINHELVEFIRSKYIAAALSGIKMNGNKEYIKYARKYFKKTLYNLGDKDAVEIMSKYGDKSDVIRLMKAASKLPQKIKYLAIKTSINLTDRKEYLIKKLLKNSDSEIFRIAAQHIKDLPIQTQILISKKLIISENDYLRSIGLSVLVSKSTINDINKTLDKYLLNDTYYYDVVTWIDRCLYAKGRYQEYFKKQIVEFE